MQEQQWLQIYRETVHPLYGYMAKRTGGDRALTEDIVQESYLRALDTWTHRAVPDSPLAWLKQVARNILIDHLRRNKWDVKSGPDARVDADHRTPADDFESLEIFRAITSLGRKKTRVLEAFYYDGMSVRRSPARWPSPSGPSRGSCGGPGNPSDRSSPIPDPMEKKMPKNLEPDSQFVDKLEWQLSSEFRRMSGLKPAAGKVAVPRWVVAFSLVAGVLLMGVAAIRRRTPSRGPGGKRLEVARLETDVVKLTHSSNSRRS